MRISRWISQLAPHTVALAAALGFSVNAHSQEAQPQPAEKIQNAEPAEKTTCPPVRKIRMPMRDGALRITHVSGAIVYVDSTRIPYIVLPPEVARRFGVVLGDLAVVINQHSEPPVSVFAIFADTGPRGKIGEGSIALAEALGLPSDPRHDRTEDGLLYVVFPGSGLGPGKLRTLEEINSATAEIYEEWGGAESLKACSLLPAPATDKAAPVASR